MTFLLTNDDGYGAEGLEVLKKRLLKDGHTVYVIAPSGNRSAVSHGMTFSSLDFVKISQNEWTCSGNPVDCVVAALSECIFPKKIDAVISGINAGANIGTDVVYSGTCAAARQAVMMGVPGIALSIQPVGEGHYLVSGAADENVFIYDPMADFAAKNIENLIKLCRVNVPSAFASVNALSLPKYRGVEFCPRLSHRVYKDVVEIKEKNDGEKGCSFESVFYGEVPLSVYAEGNDFHAVVNGKVSVSLINAEPVACAVDGIKFSL